MLIVIMNRKGTDITTQLTTIRITTSTEDGTNVWDLSITTKRSTTESTPGIVTTETVMSGKIPTEVNNNRNVLRMNYQQ